MIAQVEKTALIIPDLHLDHITAQAIIDRHQNVNSIVLTGDFFHQFSDSPAANAETARWLRKLLEADSRVTPLIGNHDATHLSPVHQFKNCPGYTKAKDKAIRAALGDKLWPRFELAVSVNGWLISHAGINPYYIPQGLGPDVGVTNMIDQATECFRTGQYHPLFHGGYRMSPTGAVIPPGGILWQDWDHEFRAVPGLQQIVGHTPSAHVRSYQSIADGGMNVCLDTGLRFYGIIQANGDLEIRRRDGLVVENIHSISSSSIPNSLK